MPRTLRPLSAPAGHPRFYTPRPPGLLYARLAFSGRFVSCTGPLAPPPSRCKCRRNPTRELECPPDGTYTY
eukprot:864606-Pyramimonas_sp.AAC.1